MTEPTGRTPDTHQMITELTRTHSHREPFEIRRGNETHHLGHVTQVPALIHQLLGAMPAGTGSEAGSAHGKSRPAARIEAIDTVMLIDHETGEWIDRLGGVIPGDLIDPRTTQRIPGSGTVRALTRLHGLTTQAHQCDRTTGRRDDTGTWCCPRHHIHHDISRWWRQARILTGWDAAAYRPWNTCPVCDHRGGLRVNPVILSAFCVECRSVWTPDEIGLLAEHIRTENHEEEAPGDGAA